MFFNANKKHELDCSFFKKDIFKNVIVVIEAKLENLKVRLTRTYSCHNLCCLTTLKM